jgi:AcrR family transcriptional regulator
MSPAHLATIDLGEVAAGLVELGPERATGAELARAAGVAKPTLYAHFGSRDGVVEACVQHEAERLLDHIHADTDPGAALAAYAGESTGWALVLLSRHEAAVATRARIAARIATGRQGATGLTAPLAARAFLAAAPAVLALEDPAAREGSLRALARALLPGPGFGLRAPPHT